MLVTFSIIGWEQRKRSSLLICLEKYKSVLSCALISAVWMRKCDDVSAASSSAGGKESQRKSVCSRRKSTSLLVRIKKIVTMATDESYFSFFFFKLKTKNFSYFTVDELSFLRRFAHLQIRAQSLSYWIRFLKKYTDQPQHYDHLRNNESIRPSRHFRCCFCFGTNSLNL